MNNFKLYNGIELPSIGYGTWRLKNNDDTVEIVKSAINCGYRLIDTASSYGNTEAVGKGIIESLKDIGRKNLYISGKLWNSDKGYNNIIRACKKAIDELGCEYLDLYLIHWPASPAVHDDWIEMNNETWRAFEYLYNEGLVKAIGVCNFKVNQLEELMKSATIKPMVNQIEYHVGFMQNDIVEYCKRNDIVVEAWSPLGSGKMLKVEELNKMAEKYGVSTAQLCIKWCLQNGVLPLPKSKNEERMRQNLDVFDFEISKEDMQILNNMPYLGGSGLDSEEIMLFG